jgi:antirestriction protein ArdC
MTKERFDIHQHITDKIVSAIERGAGDFRLPWHRSAGNIMRPVNIASKKAYRGVNVVALWAYAEEFGYSSGTWGTYKQWTEAGAQVRKGEKAAFVVFYKELEFAADPEMGNAETATRLFARATPVFAAEQVDGYQVPVVDPPARDGHHPDRAGRGFRRRDRRNHHVWRQPGLLSSFDGQHSASPARSLHRHPDEHAGGIVLFHATP